MSGKGGQILQYLGKAGTIIGAVALLAHSIYSYSQQQEAIIANETASHRDSGAFKDCDPNLLKTTAGFTDTGDLTVTTTGKDDKGNKITVKTVFDSDGNIKSKTKEVEDVNGNKTYYKWVTDENGKNGHWELVTGMSVDDEMDKTQSFFANQLLKKVLITKDKKRFEELMAEEGPVIRYEDNGRKVFIFNPYYKGKDPMKEEIWRVQNADGTWGFVRNPFIPGSTPLWSNTFEMFQQKGFFQPEVDPYEQVIREEVMKENLNNKSHIMRY